MNILDLFSEPRLHGFTRSFLCGMFSYDPATGLVTRKDKAASIVGTVDGKKYLHVSVYKKFIRLHQLAWFITHGWCPRALDHKNNDRTDNRLSNLRPANPKQNAGNIRAPAHNTSGFKGASLNTRSGKWHAQIKLNGKQTYLGRFDTPEEAARVYDAAAVAHFGEYAKGNNV